MLFSYSLEIALEDADVDERALGGIRPEVLAAEAHVVSGLILRLDAVGMSVGKRIGRRLADDHPRLAADIGRHPYVARHVVEPHPDTVPGLEALARRRVAAPGRAFRRERKQASSPALQLFARHDALLDAQRRQAGERALVIAGRQVVARLHALDRVTVLVHVENAEPHRQGVERIHADFPILVERRCVRRMTDLAEALPASQVVSAVHAASRYRRATPIRPSRVTMPASFSSGQPAVPAGRSGSTM